MSRRSPSYTQEDFRGTSSHAILRRRSAHNVRLFPPPGDEKWWQFLHSNVFKATNRYKFSHWRNTGGAVPSGLWDHSSYFSFLQQLWAEQRDVLKHCLEAPRSTSPIRRAALATSHWDSYGKCGLASDCYDHLWAPSGQDLAGPPYRDILHQWTTDPLPNSRRFGGRPQHPMSHLQVPPSSDTVSTSSLHKQEVGTLPGGCSKRARLKYACGGWQNVL